MVGQVEFTDTEQVFRVGLRPLILVITVLVILAILPVASLHELLTTGTIDMDAVGRGRRQIPIWISYVVGWTGFLMFVGPGVTALRYLWHREMFRLGPYGIRIRGETLAPEEVLGFRSSIFRGHVLRSTRGDFPIHPKMSNGTVEALAEAFPHVPPPR